MNAPLPDYVEYGPRETAPPPFVSGGGNFLGLILKGNTEAIEDLCDNVLNKPFEGGKSPGLPQSPFTYKPFSDAVLLFAGSYRVDTKHLHPVGGAVGAEDAAERFHGHGIGCGRGFPWQGAGLELAVRLLIAIVLAPVEQ